jgi:superfamily II DNA or RNA helicase
LSKELTILRAGNWIILDPAGPHIRKIATPILRFTATIYLRGREQYLAKAQGRSLFQEEDYDCFDLDVRGRVRTRLGFADALTAAFTAEGYSVKLQEVKPPPRPEAYVADWSRVFTSENHLRYKQDEILLAMATYNCGRIDCHGGYGKSELIRMACELFPRAHFAVVVKGVPILTQRLYPLLCRHMTGVGVFGGGRKNRGRRVNCYSADSLHYASGDEDFVICDECHLSAADKFAESLGKFRHAHMWGFSATQDMRLDGKDKRCESLFGPIRVTVTHAEGVAQKITVPMVVELTQVPMGIDPGEGLENDIDKERACIWTNDYRNRLIARDALAYPADAQILVVVRTIEHGLHLRRLLPGFTFAYAEPNINNLHWQQYVLEGNFDERFRDFPRTTRDNIKRWRRFLDQGLIEPGFRPLDTERLTDITAAFERGELKKAIVTTIWNAGVDFRHLQVVVRADAGGSPINDTQIPSRAARIGVEGKEVGILRDYLDSFSNRYARKASGRISSYEKNKWQIVYPTAQGSLGMRWR